MTHQFLPVNLASSHNDFSSPFFSLKIHQTAKQTHLTMRLFGTKVTTKSYPHTLSFLHKHFPAVLSTQCFNDLKLPFRKEVCDTELGHLFEHILIQQMCEIDEKKGKSCFSIRADTSWNWREEERGTFQIKINRGSDNRSTFFPALAHTNQLFNLLLAN